LCNLYNDNIIEFSCAANWIDYYQKNQKTGDLFECVFAHVDSKYDTSNLKDSHNKKMGENLFVLTNVDDGSKYLRYEPIILSPIMCFYGISMKQLLNNKEGHSSFKFDIDGFSKAFEYSSDYGILIIDKPFEFINELSSQLSKCIMNNNNLTSERFYKNFDPLNPIDASFVDYNKYKMTDLFFDQECVGQEIFWKDEKYSWQNEFRIIVKNINFKQYYHPLNYDYKKNNLQITLPNLKKYSRIISLKDANEFIISKSLDNPQECVYSFIKKNDMR